jgi:hypothetical protein
MFIKNLKSKFYVKYTTSVLAIITNLLKNYLVMKNLKVQNKYLFYFKKFIKKHFKSLKSIGKTHLDQI